MGTERKSTMVSARLPAALVARTDYVVRNNDGDVKNRSVAIQIALENWLPEHELEIEKRLGTSAKKAR